MSEKKRSNLAIHNLMRTADGRDYVWQYLQSCGVFETIYTSDPMSHAFNAGKREAGLMLKRDIESNEPAYYVKMIEENIDG